MEEKIQLSFSIKKEEKQSERDWNLFLDKDSFDEVGKIAGNSEYNEKGELKDFTPPNFIRDWKHR